jgi:hypothetical protein
MISVWQALNIVGREFGKPAQMLPNRSMNNLAKSTMLVPMHLFGVNLSKVIMDA